jgi:hypothetical protein
VADLNLTSLEKAATLLKGSYIGALRPLLTGLELDMTAKDGDTFTLSLFVSQSVLNLGSEVKVTASVSMRAQRRDQMQRGLRPWRLP